MSKLNVNLDLVKKYNVAGPRYTSYPPATKFTDAISWEQLSAKIEENNRTPRDLSVYFHIPFCETLCWFCGCTTVITLNHDTRHGLRRGAGPRSGEDGAEAESAAQGRPTPFRRRLADVSAARTKSAGSAKSSTSISRFRRTSKPAWRWTRAGSRATTWWRCAKSASTAPRWACRISIPKVQEAIHRIQPREMTQQAMDWMRELGYGSINLDLIYGLPFQTPESFNETLDTVLEMKPDRLAVFSYAHVPWIKPSQKILEHENPAHAGNQAGSAQARHRKAHGGRPIRLYRHGPFREADRRTGRGAAREKAPAEFSGLQHARRLGHLRVRHVEHFADSRRLLAERKGTAEMAGRRGRRQSAVAHARIS